MGDLLYDLLARVDEVTFGTDTFAPIHADAGGSGANAAAWLAASGVETHFVGRVGDDVFGDFLTGKLESADVKARLARDATLATGKVFVLVDEAGERTMITDRGASEALRPTDLPRDLFAAGHLHLSGYTFSRGTRRETGFEALRRARDAGMTVSVDPSSAPLLREIQPKHFLEWTSGADLCFPNLQEGSLLAGTNDPEAITQALCEHYAGVVLKLGAEGAMYAERDSELIHLPAAPARVVDTTGAGDALCAGFLAGWTSGRAPEETLARGLTLAAQAVGRVGGRPEG